MYIYSFVKYRMSTFMLLAGGAYGMRRKLHG